MFYVDDLSNGRSKKRRNTANVILKTVTVNMGFQMSPITHGYTNNHLFKLKYILQETTNALYTYCIMQFSTEGPEKPAGFTEGDGASEGS